MAKKIRFNVNHNPIQPTLVLGHRSGALVGALPYYNYNITGSMTDGYSISFQVSKYNNGEEYLYWDEIKDLRFVWLKDWNQWFEIYVEVSEESGLVKNITGTDVGHAELSQINLYNIQINTDDDIALDDYVPTCLWNAENTKGSLLHRISEKIPHYTYAHVDTSIAKLYRQFEFDDESMWDAFNDIAEELNCIFVTDVYTGDDGKIHRDISVYDLENYCHNDSCNYYVQKGYRYREENMLTCPKCGSTNISHGYGNDTTIFVAKENLAQDITYTTDIDNVKNCFNLVAGDDVMTAAIRGCNPNGSDYLWYIPQETRDDMSSELQEKLSSYDEQYKYYNEDYQMSLDVSTYNTLVQKYKQIDTESKIETIDTSVKGFSNLTLAYYNTVDFYYYLKSELMPSATLNDTTAAKEAAKLSSSSLSPVAVADLQSVTTAATKKAVISKAKTIVDFRYDVTASEYKYDSSTHAWSGKLTVKNSYIPEGDEENYTEGVAYSTITIAESSPIYINDDYENYIKQKIELALNDENTKDVSITSLFKKDITVSDDTYSGAFVDELHKYCYDSLSMFYQCAEDVLSIMQEAGYGDPKHELYQSYYLPYYNKERAISKEMKVRADEIGIQHDDETFESGTISDTMQAVTKLQNEIYDKLNFKKYIGDYWTEFCSYRRDSSYSNDNYVSDALTNAQIVARAMEFFETAQKEIYKSANLQHSISSTLNNLLVMKEFEPLLDSFELGNWIRIRIDGKVYKLRLIQYDLSFDDLTTLNVEFSDVKNTVNGLSDLESVISQASSMSSSYSTVQRQASAAEDTTKSVDHWVERGLDATNLNIMNNATNQDQVWTENGMLFRKYDPVTEDYANEQMKIINSTIAITSDNWKTIGTALGKINYIDPETGDTIEDYGIIAKKIIGTSILGEEAKFYTTDSSVSIDSNGLVITGKTSNDIPLFKVRRKESDGSCTDLLYLDSSGQLIIDGTATFKNSLGTSKSVVSVVIQYGKSNSIDVEPTEWVTESPVLETGEYLWQRTLTTYADGSSVVSDCSVVSTVVPGAPGEKGDKGDKGDPGKDGTNGKDGKDGRGITNITEFYAVSSSDATVPEVWSDSVPTMDATNKYLWNYEVVTYTDKTTEETKKRVIGVFGEDGENGADGKAIGEIVNYYLATNASTGVNTSTSGWTTTVQSVSASKKYLWNYEVIKYTDNTVASTSTPCIIGAYGDTGAKGDKGDPGTDGVGVTDITEYYAVSSNNTTPPTSWSKTVPTMTETNKYLWNYEVITYSNGDTSETTKRVIGSLGKDGTNGTNGTDGKSIGSVTNYYLATNASTGVNTSTSGWTTTVQSVSASKKYLWNYEVIKYTDNTVASTSTPCIIGAYGDTGAKGDKGDPGNAGADATVYSVLASTSSVSKNISHSAYSPSSITFTSYSQTGDADRAAYTGRILVQCKYGSYTSSVTYAKSSVILSPVLKSSNSTTELESVIATLYASTDTSNSVPLARVTVSVILDADALQAQWCSDNDTTLIDGAKIYTGSITANQIAANTITGDKISGNTITGDKITGNTITADKITSSEITAHKFVGDYIQSDNYKESSNKATAGTKIFLTTGEIRTKNFTVDSSGNVSVTGAITSSSLNVGNGTMKYDTTNGLVIGNSGNVSVSGSIIAKTLNVGNGTMTYDSTNGLVISNESTINYGETIRTVTEYTTNKSSTTYSSSATWTSEMPTVSWSTDYLWQRDLRYTRAGCVDVSYIVYTQQDKVQYAYNWPKTVNSYTEYVFKNSDGTFTPTSAQYTNRRMGTSTSTIARYYCFDYSTDYGKTWTAITRSTTTSTTFTVNFDKADATMYWVRGYNDYTASVYNGRTLDIKIPVIDNSNSNYLDYLGSLAIYDMGRVALNGGAVTTGTVSAFSVDVAELLADKIFANDITAYNTINLAHKGSTSTELCKIDYQGIHLDYGGVQDSDDTTVGSLGFHIDSVKTTRGKRVGLKASGNLHCLATYCDKILSSQANKDGSNYYYIEIANEIAYTGMPSASSATTTAAYLGVTTGNSLNLLRKYGSSSNRYKHDIKYGPDIPDGLQSERLLDIPMASFIYNDDYLSEDDERYNTAIPGFIAEDVAQYYPVATYHENGEIENWQERYVVPGMLDLIQKLYKRVEELELKLKD